jgi:hypothetical protein
MAIVTKYTFGKLCSEIDIDLTVSKNDFRDHIYSDDQVFYMFNSRENRYLFIYASILGDAEGFRTKYYQFVPEKEDGHIYVNEKGGKAHYHLHDGCPMLLKDFEDFYIPSDIRNMNNEAIKEYRDWFRSMNFAHRFEQGQIHLADIVQEFNKKYPTKYGIQPLEENYNLYQKIPNTGNSRVEDTFNLSKFESELEQLKIEFDEEFSSHDWRKFSKFSGYRDKTSETIYELLSEAFPGSDLKSRIDINSIRHKLNKAADLKRRMISSLITYLRWHHHFDQKNFDPSTLADFGLKCCTFCERKEKEDSSRL